MGSGDFHHISALLIENVLRGRGYGSFGLGTSASARQNQPVDNMGAGMDSIGAQGIVAQKNASGGVKQMAGKARSATGQEPITVIHFDNHPDWVRFEGGMHCGSWVTRIAAHPGVARVVTVGVTSSDLTNPDWKGAGLDLLRDGALELFPYDHAPSRVRRDYGQGASHMQQARHITWNTIRDMGEEAFTARLLTRIPTRDVYITIDKDVLSRADVETNWDQGQMRLPYLLSLIGAIGRAHRIVGADVNGDYSAPHYSGPLLTRMMKRGEILLDQPRHRRDVVAASALNQASNLALLAALEAVMA